MPDTKLETAIEEIRQICIKHDCAAFIALSSETHMEFLAQLNPTWSCVYPVDGGIRIKALKDDFPSVEKQKEAITNTVGMMIGFHRLLSEFAGHFKNIIEIVDSKFGISSINTLDRKGPPR